MKLWHYLSLAVAAVLLGGFGVLADEVSEGSTMAFDNWLVLSLRVPGDPSKPLGPAWLEETARDITSLGSVVVLGLFVLALVGYLALSGRRLTAGFLAVSVGCGALISTILKIIFDRPRPDIPGVTRVFSASFPSGHATLSAVVYLTAAIIFANMMDRRAPRVFALAIAAFLTVSIGVTRVYLGVHFPSDVAAGWALGTAWTLLTYLVLRYLEQRDQRGSATGTARR